MTDQSPAPALPSTADTTPYVPVSWMAVAADVVAGLFLTALLALGLAAFANKKPLIMPELLVLPVVGVVLSFAARRLIRNSEGTRTGENLVSAAWWTCLVGGLGYVAYLFAIEYSIRREAESQVEQWVGHILAGDADGDEAARVAFNRAFKHTLDPGRRRNIPAENTAQLMAEFRDQYVGFRQCDIVRIARRNPGTCKFIPGGLKDWQQRPGGVECSYGGVLDCPEGRFPLSIPLRGMEAQSGAEAAAAGRQWRVDMPQNGFIDFRRATFTPYGWQVVALEQSADQFAREFAAASRAGPAAVPYLYQVRIRPGGDRAFWNAVVANTVSRVAAGGGPAALAPFHTADYAAYFANDFYRLPGGGEPAPEQKTKFHNAWRIFGLLPAGERLKGTPDTNDLLTFAENSVEVRVPFELPMPDGTGSVARVRLVVGCSDPALLAELQRLRDEAKPEQGTSSPPPELRTRQYPWRVLRVESDLYPVNPNRGPGGPGGPGGPEG